MNQFQAMKTVANGSHEDAIKLADMLSAEKKTKPSNCEVHGAYESRFIIGSIWSKCPTCSAELVAERERVEAEKEAQHKRAVWQSKLKLSGIPERFHSRTLDSFIVQNEGQKRAHAFAKEYADSLDAVMETGRCAIFCGMPGTGKTHLAVGIGLAAIEKRKNVGFVTVQRMMRRIKDSWRKESDESETDVINLFAQADLLIVDEIGVQFGSDFERNAMFDVLNERYESRKPTLLLSNLTPQEVKAFLGERVFDRLREDGGKCVPFDWESYRGQA